MNGPATASTALNLSTADLESLIRRVVREEFARVLRKPDRAILDYWEHEGAEDPEGDAQLLAEALALVEQYQKNPQGWITLEEFEAELERPENAA